MVIQVSTPSYSLSSNTAFPQVSHFPLFNAHFLGFKIICHFFSGINLAFKMMIIWVWSMVSSQWSIAKFAYIQKVAMRELLFFKKKKF